MPTFDIDAEPLRVFRVGDRYLFTHYFERDDIFAALSEYYHDDEYRFEVPVEAFDSVRTVLADAFVEPVVVEDPEPYAVVIDRYEKHADILRNAVLTWDRRGHRFFLMKDELAVEMAIERGARPVAETEFVLGL